jgi:hypothetical protein
VNANDVIESYVNDVAVRLPRKQRNDVAFELRSLISEELQARARAAGRPVDEAMATEFLGTFGRPMDVAARYRPTLTIIDPADGPAFVRATVVGLVIIWVLGLVTFLQRQGVASGSDVLLALGRWWVGVVIPSMWWPGVLVVGFGLGAWSRRRWPQTSEWKPRGSEALPGSRASLVMGLVGVLFGLAVLIDPRWVLDGAHAAPAAYQALTYTDTFRGRQGPFLLALLALNVPLLIIVLVKGRWSATLRRVETGLNLALCGVLAWTVLGGPVVLGPEGDRVTKLMLSLVILLTLIKLGLDLRRIVRPAPNPSVQTQR